MTLQSENGAPFFDYGIRETLWSYATPESNSDLTAFSKATSTSSAQTGTERITRISLPGSVLQSLKGTYFSEQVNRTYDITLKGRNIYLQIDRQQKLELVPVSEDTLYAGEGHLIKFHLTSMGDIDRLDLYDHGRHIVALRQ
jgi:hypothetical protein